MLDALEQIVPDQVAGGGFEPEAGPQLRGLDVGAVSGLLYPGPLQIVGTAPAMLVVEGVSERIERSAPARRGDVEAPAGLKVAPRGEDVDVSASAALAVQHGRPRIAVEVQSRPRGLLEGVQNSADLFVGRFVLRRPRASASVLSGGDSAASARLMAMRWPITSTASMAPLWVFAHRAIWLRLLPTRAKLAGALALDLGVPDGPGARPANRAAHQIRQRQACGARLGVPLGTLRLAGANLHPHGASGAHGAPLPFRDSPPFVNAS